MHVELTIREGDELEEIRELIAELRARLRENLTIFEVPPALDSPVPFPLLTLEFDNTEERVFGRDAVARLRDIMAQAA